MMDEPVEVRPVFLDVGPDVTRWRASTSVVNAPFCPSPPKGSAVLLEGRCVPEGPTERRYPPNEAELVGRDLRVLVQAALDPNWGLRVWMEHKGTWFLESTHVVNTLLNDPEFDAVTDRMLAALGGA